MSKEEQGKDDENLEAASEAAKRVADERNRPLDRLVRFVAMIASPRSLPILYAMLAIVVTLAVLVVFRILYGWGYFSTLGLKTPPEALYLSTVVLVLFYGAIFVASCLYRYQLRKQYKAEHAQYRIHTDGIPKILATWFLPLASILLVLSTQVASIQNMPMDTPDLRYTLTFNATRSIILLMVGMELSYFVQEHHGAHRWWVLITASLLLDFVSYIIMIVGLGDLNLLKNRIQGERSDKNLEALYMAVLGFASLWSSYFTIVQARQADEVFGLSHSKETA